MMAVMRALPCLVKFRLVTSMLRLIDANINRLREGLRFLEEVARFQLNDAGLTQQLKSLRHELTWTGKDFRRQLLAARSVGEDVGAQMEVSGQEQRDDLVAAVVANAIRAQESLRVLEESGKLYPLTLDYARFQKARFDVYQLEQALVSRLLRQPLRQKVKGLYVIVDPEQTGGREATEVARLALRGGAQVVQLRDKVQAKGLQLATARDLKELCDSAGALLIINDHVDLAVAVGAHGVHLGQKDLTTAAARRMLPLETIVGCSTALVEEALRAQEEGADYVAVGSIFPTASKADTRPAGLETLKQVREAVAIPVVAIGGINADNLGSVKASGADAFAVISAVASAPDVQAAAVALCLKWENLL